MPSPKDASTKAPPPADRIVEARFAYGATSSNQFPPPTLTEIAFAGRSNVGKSSLLNSLTERKGLVRTSSTPGCTRQVSWFHVRLGDGVELQLVDLPGYGYAKRSKGERDAWAQLIERYLLERPTLRGVVALVDVRRGIEEDDEALLDLLASTARTSRPELGTTLVATKLDKLSRSARKPALQALESGARQRIIGFSVPEGLGRLPLVRRIRTMAGLELPPAEPEAPGQPAAPDE